MAYKILSDCNNCGACEPECPNTAISMGADVYVINADLCTECVAFHDTPQCAAVCPIDVCVTDPAMVETEEQLLKKVQKLHPEKTIPGTFPSHFRSH